MTNFLKKYKPSFNYSEEFLNLLYNETDYCLEIFNKFVGDIINKYIDEKISLEDLQEYKNWEFKCLNNKRKNMYSKIFPNFIQLLIENVDLMDIDKKDIIIIKPRQKVNSVLFDDEIDKNKEIHENEENTQTENDSEHRRTRGVLY